MSSASAPRPVGQFLLRIAGVAIVYYATARLGLVLKFRESNASPVWPPTGIGFASVLLLGYHVWPGIMIGAFLANLLTLPQTLAGFTASIATNLQTSSRSGPVRRRNGCRAGDRQEDRRAARRTRLGGVQAA